jgi:hypothetical protein
MKVNDRTLVRYASSADAQATKQGWLLKRSKEKAEYQRRFCVLKGNLLFLFEKQIDREPLAAVLLEGSRVELDDGDSQLFAFRIVFAPPASRQYVFCTDSQPSLESWMKALATCSIGILRLVAGELRRELQQIEDETNAFRSLQQHRLSAPLPEMRHSMSFDSSSSARVNPFDQHNLIDFDDLHNGNRSSCSSAPTSDSSANRSDHVLFSRRPFVDLHQFYGLQFAQYFERKQKPKSVDELLLL